jgi:hypothetical protein
VSNHQPEEITLRDILLLIRDYLRYFLRKWYLFLVAGLLGAGWFGYDAHTTEGTYSAGVKFALNEESGGPAGGLGSVLGQFGLGGQGGVTNFLKLVELARSAKIMNELLFDSIGVNTDTLLVANRIIALYKYHDAWEESEEMIGFVFDQAETSKFTRNENRAMKSLQARLRGNTAAGVEGLCSIEFDGESGIVRMNVSTTDEELSLHITAQWYSSLSKLYINQSVANQRHTLTNIEVKVDSIRGVLNSLQGRYARLQDRRTGIVLRKNLTEIDRVQRELGLNQILYGEAVKNQEQARFLLANQTPVFSIVESTVSPVSINQPSLLTSIIKGGIVAGILAGIVLFGIKLYLDTMNEKGIN